MRTNRNWIALGWKPLLKHAGWAIVLLSLIFPRPASGQAPERQESFVYATTFFDGLAYGSALVPPETGTFYLTAGIVNIVAPRRTLVYFWPLTNRYLADWNRMNELVEGTLEVYQAGELIQEVTLSNYIIQYDSERILETLKLYTGDEARESYERFKTLQKDFQQEMFAFSRARQAWLRQIEEIIRDAEPGRVAADDLPPPPEQPAGFTLYSTEIAQGYALSLPAGTYTIQMRLADGSIQPDSVKRLVVFNQRRTAVAYRIIPQRRWTKPEESQDPRGVIYTPPGTVLYLQPLRESQFNELLYRRMNDPQDPSARADRWIWVSHEPYAASHLQLMQDGRLLAEVSELPYYVRQTGSGSLGYEIVTYDPETMERISFSAYQIRIDADNPRFEIRLMDEDGRPVAGSRREVRVLFADRAWTLYALSAIPLAVGSGVMILRRRRIQTKILAEA